MIQRSACVFEGHILGIEMICTQNNGRIEYIEEKRDWLKVQSRENKLFCPCGCGNKLNLVAGKIRRPHFKIKETSGAGKCIVTQEGAISIWSRIILKCWLDTKLQSNRIES